MTTHPISTITVQSPVMVQNLTVFPLTQEASAGPGYISSIRAFEEHGLQITEISDGGSVPNLMVENPSANCVLLLDGEELRGAKQNRIVNTTLLLAARSKTLIPVSCTESGRWNYSSPTFSHSKTIMSTKARRKKTRSVSDSLLYGDAFNSDQGEVWGEVDELNLKVGSHSPTSAMAAAYEKMRSELESALEKMPMVENQCGLIAMINGKPAGVDMLSQSGVYGELHPQLVQSYAMEALASRQLAPVDKPGQNGPTYAEYTGPFPDVLAAKAFLEQCAAIKGKSYRSVALGEDWRFVSPTIVGSGLEVDDTWIHMAYFVDEPDSDEGPIHRGRMARMSHRSRYRRGENDDIVY